MSLRSNTYTAQLGPFDVPPGGTDPFGPGGDVLVWVTADDGANTARRDGNTAQLIQCSIVG
jgi:hypothetical protein